MQFGLINAGIIAQGGVREMRERDLSNYTKDHSMNYADDFTGYCSFVDDGKKQAPDWEGLLQSFREHVEMADKNNMSFKASKTCFGEHTKLSSTEGRSRATASSTPRTISNQSRR